MQPLQDQGEPTAGRHPAAARYTNLKFHTKPRDRSVVIVWLAGHSIAKQLRILRIASASVVLVARFEKRSGHSVS